MTNRRAATAIMLAAIYIGSAVAHADPKELIECPDHSHVWNSQQCDDNSGTPFGIPGSGGPKTGGGGGLLGIVGRLTRGIL